MTCESPIDQGDSRSYNITVLLGSHRVKGHEGAERLSRERSAFSCPRETATRGTARWRGWPASARDALRRSPRFAGMRDSGLWHERLSGGEGRNSRRPIFDVPMPNHHHHGGEYYRH